MLAPDRHLNTNSGFPPLENFTPPFSGANLPGGLLSWTQAKLLFNGLDHHQKDEAQVTVNGILEYLHSLPGRNMVCPTLRDMADACERGLKVVWKWVQRLSQHGLFNMLSGTPAGPNARRRLANSYFLHRGNTGIYISNKEMDQDENNNSFLLDMSETFEINQKHLNNEFSQYEFDVKPPGERKDRYAKKVKEAQKNLTDKMKQRPTPEKETSPSTLDLVLNRFWSFAEHYVPSEYSLEDGLLRKEIPSRFTEDELKFHKEEAKRLRTPVGQGH